MYKRSFCVFVCFDFALQAVTSVRGQVQDAYSPQPLPTMHLLYTSIWWPEVGGKVAVYVQVLWQLQLPHSFCPTNREAVCDPCNNGPVSAHSQLPHAQLAEARAEKRLWQFEVILYVTKKKKKHHFDIIYMFNLLSSSGPYSTLKWKHLLNANVNCTIWQATIIKYRKNNKVQFQMYSYIGELNDLESLITLKRT